jgi:hypothetical protein
MSFWMNSVSFNLDPVPSGRRRSARSSSYDGMKTLTGLSLSLITIGILVLLFPRILAFLVATLFFAAAAFCLITVWKLYQKSK